MLEINNLKYSYKDRTILNGVTFEIRLNQFIGIFGATSSGKSSIFETILNLKSFSNGTIIYENKKVLYSKNKQIKKLKQDIGYISQDDFFLEDETVLDNLNWISKVSKERIVEISSLAGITDILYAKVDAISESEKIRFKLALALTKSPTILFLDEPLISLNIDEVDKFLDLVYSIAKNEKFGVVVTSQDIQKFHQEKFDKIFKLENGVLNEI